MSPSPEKRVNLKRLLERPVHRLSRKEARKVTTRSLVQ